MRTYKSFACLEVHGHFLGLVVHVYNPRTQGPWWGDPDLEASHSYIVRLISKHNTKIPKKPNTNKIVKVIENIFKICSNRTYMLYTFTFTKRAGTTSHCQ